ncbi:NB-ARC domain-containing protein [Arthrospira sp. PCC 9108]|nr:NB-ARC domain-containing protein [Arthrospira sp. PCC 9108]
MTGNNLGALVERFRNSSEVLRNEDIAKAAGRTVAKALAEKISPKYPDIRKPLDNFANEIEGYWLQWAEEAKTLNLFETLQEDQLYQVFSQQPEQFTEYQVLPLEEWREVVTWLFQQGCEKGVLLDTLDSYQDVIEELTGELAANFNKHLRQVLKDDANNEGKAFVGMLFDLHGATLAKVDEIRDYLPEIATRQDMRLILAAISQLQRPNPPAPATPWHGLGAIATVPKPPPHFLPRPEDIDELKARLLAPNSQTLVMTGQVQKVGVQGMGGIGKTVLAAALARDNEVRRRFRDGIIWLTVGINPQPMELYDTIAKTLGGSHASQQGESQWNAYLSNLLWDKSCLLVLDDVWEQREAERFVEVLGPDCCLLLTTRDARLIAGLGANGYELEMLDENQSRQLLANWAGLHIEMLPATEAAAVIDHCGNLPLALALCGAQVGVDKNWADLLTALDAAAVLDHPHSSIYKSLDVSVAALGEPLRRAYLELGIVAQDVEISETALVKLWGRRGEKQEYQLRRWLTELAQRALVFVSGESPQRWVSLHDVQQKYLQDNLRDEAGLHGEFLRAYGGGQFPWTGAEVAAEVYLYQRAAYHFRKAGEIEAFRGLLWDFAWLQGKLEATDVRSLLADFEAVGEDEDRALRVLEGAIRLSSHVLDQDKTQLISQLWGRLLSFVESPQTIGNQEELSLPEPYRYFWEKIPVVGRYLPKYAAPQQQNAKGATVGEIEQLLHQAQQWQEKPWFRPLTANLTPPGGPLIRTLTGHSDRVRAVAIAPDGKRAVSGSWDDTLKLWDLEQGRELATLSGHSSSVTAVAIAPDGKRAVSASADYTLKLWDLEQGRELATLSGHSDWVRAVAIAPDGKRAVSASDDETLKLWDLEQGRELATLSGHSGSVYAVAIIAPDGKRAVSASDDKTLKLWDLEQGRELATLSGHRDSVWAVAIAPDGKRAVSASRDKTLKLWDLEQGRELATLSGHSDWVNAVAIAPDGKRAVSASADETLKLWDLEQGRELATLSGHSSWVNAVAIIAPDGKRAVSASADKTLKLWDLEQGRELATLSGHSSGVLAVAIAPDGKRAVSASLDNTLKLWDLEQGRELATLSGHSSGVLAVAIAPDGKRAVSASADYTLKLWDLEQGRELATLSGHSYWVNAVAIAPDGKRAVSASDDETLKLWDLEQGRELATLSGHSSYVRAVAIAPDGKRAVSASEDNTLKLWDLEQGRELATLSGHSHWVTAVAIAPDGKRAVSASADYTLKLWDLEQGRELATLSGHSGWVRAVAIAPDGKRAVSASADKTLKLWDLEQGRELATLSGHSDEVNAVAIAPDGKRAVSASDDKTLKLWDLATGEEIASFTADTGVLACAVAPDGVTLVAGDRSGRVHFLRLEGL